VTIRQILLGGIIASLVIAMWEMVVEAILSDGAGFFGPVLAIGATLVRDLQGSGNPIRFDLLAVVLGLAGHMMNSVVLAVVFGLVVSRLQLTAALTVAAGAAWGAMVFVVMWFIVGPAIDPLLSNLNGPVFFLGHLMWGATLGLLWTRLAEGNRSPSGSLMANR